VKSLRNFLFEKVYSFTKKVEQEKRAEKILEDLFYYIKDTPDNFIAPYPEEDSPERRIADFIAGMTDHYALRLYEKLFLPEPWTIF
jgi:dGTPase